LQYRDSREARRWTSQRVLTNPRASIWRAVEDEFAKFERKERAFRRADKQKRAAKLHLPVRFDVDQSCATATERKAGIKAAQGMFI
jgi:hypothetical protein